MLTIMGSLSPSRVLRTYVNRISGSIPDSWSSMTKLQYVDVAPVGAVLVVLWVHHPISILCSVHECFFCVLPGCCPLTVGSQRVYRLGMPVVGLDTELFRRVHGSYVAVPGRQWHDGATEPHWVFDQPPVRRSFFS